MGLAATAPENICPAKSRRLPATNCSRSANCSPLSQDLPRARPFVLLIRQKDRLVPWAPSPAKRPRPAAKVPAAQGPSAAFLKAPPPRLRALAYHVHTPRHVEYARRPASGCCILSLRSLDGKEVQKHLESLSAQKIGIVKFLVARFVVDNGNSRRPVCPVYRPDRQSRRHRLPSGVSTITGGSLPLSENASSLVAWGEARHTQLVCYIFNDSKHLLAVSSEEIRAPLVRLLRGRHKILRVLVHVPRRDPEDRFRGTAWNPPCSITSRTVHSSTWCAKVPNTGASKLALPPRLEF